MYSNYYNLPAYRSQISNSSFSNPNYAYSNMNNDRLIAGGFLGPFLLGGITGGLLAPAFAPRPYYNNYYYPYPYYGPYYR